MFIPERWAYLEVLEMLRIDMLLLHSLLLLVVVMLLLLELLEAQVSWLQLLQDSVLLTARLRLRGVLRRGRSGSYGAKKMPKEVIRC